MNVRVEIHFKSPGQEEWSAMKTLAKDLTNNTASVQVFAGEAPSCLVAEFTMPTEAQYVAVEKVDNAIRFSAFNGMDITIAFPKSEAERARAERKAERRRANRRERKAT